MGEDDALLMREIRAIADKAFDAKSQNTDIAALAKILHANFPDRTEDEIVEKLKGAFRDRNLFWRT